MKFLRYFLISLLISTCTVHQTYNYTIESSEELEKINMRLIIDVFFNNPDTPQIKIQAFPKELDNIEEIETIDFEKRVKLLTSIEKMLQIPLLEVDNNQMQQILNGQLIELTLLSGEYALMSQKKFLGIGQSDGNFIKPIRLIKNEIN